MKNLIKITLMLLISISLSACANTDSNVSSPSEEVVETTVTEENIGEEIKEVEGKSRIDEKLCTKKNREENIYK